MKRGSCWVAGLVIGVAIMHGQGATISWTNTSGGLWSAPLNWSPHAVPGQFDSAQITAAGTYAVAIDTAVAVASLTVGGGAGQQTLTNYNQNIAFTNMVVAPGGVFNSAGGTLSGGPLGNQGTVTLSGGTLAVPLTVSAGAMLNLTGAGVAFMRPLTNNGTVQWSGSGTSITIYNNQVAYTATIYNQAGALFDVQNNQGLYAAGYGFEAFVNAGTFRKSAGATTTTINVGFTNSGTVEALSGVINFASGGNIGGTYNTAAGATIQFGSGSYTQTGTVTNTGSGLFRQYGATVTLNERITKFVLASGNVVISPTFQGTGSIQNLQLDGATLTGTNRVTGTLGINGGGLGSASPLTVLPGGVLNFNGVGAGINSPITNSGTINWSGAALTLANNGALYTGAIYNQPSGLFNMQNDQAVYAAGYGSELFSNAGTVRKSAGLGTSTFNVLFTNSGTVDAQSGTIQFSGGGNVGGAYNTAAGTLIQFTAGSFTQTGTPTVTGAGICRQNGATVTLSDQIANLALVSGNVVLSPTFQTNGTIASLQLRGAVLTGTNVVSGTLGFDGGGLGSGSPLTVAGTGVLNFNGAAVGINSPITNLGTINWSSGALTLANNTLLYTGAIYNQPGAVFNLQCDQALYAAGYGFESVSNGGTVRKTAGLGVSSINLPFSTTGTVEAQSGIIQFSGGGNLGGSYNAGPGSLIQFTAGSFTQTGTPTVTGAGICRQNGASVTLTDQIPRLILASGNVVLAPNFQGTGAVQNLQLDGAVLTGANLVTGTLGLNGGGVGSASPLTITPTGVLNFNGASAGINSPLTNSGTINWRSGSLTLAHNAALYTGVIYNQPGAVFNLQCDQNIYTAGYGFEMFNNAGTIRKTAGLGTTTFALALANTGTLDAQSGTIRFSGPYVQTGGTMNFGITSLAYFGQIAFSSVAPLTGTLSVNFNGGYFPSAGDSFALMTYGSRSGSFVSLALPPEAQWQTNYSATTFTLSVLSVSTVPQVRLTPISLGSGVYTLQINGSVGPSYVLLASTNLSTWTPISTNTPLAMPFTVTDPNAGSFSRRFYRAQQVGP